MRIRLLLTLLLLLPVTAHAAGADVSQQGTWTLRTSTSPQMTKDFFCASENSFSNGYKMIVARNILGQTSIILTWPGFTGAVGGALPIRISVDQKPLRDVQGTLKATGMLVIALGWDDEALGRLADAKKVTFTAAKTDVNYTIFDNNKAFTRLTSCTASLVDRLPDSSALSADVGKTLRKAGLGHAKVVHAGVNKTNAENFLIDNVFGGSSLLPDGSTDVMQRMLEYVDQLELLCRANFTSELGAPVSASGNEIASAEAQCDSAHTGALTALAFVKDGRKIRVYYFEGDKERIEQLKTLRDRTLKALD